MLEVLFAVFIVGVVGTTTGGLLALLLKKKNIKIELLYGFAGGVMLTMVLSDLIIEAVKTSNVYFALSFFAVGFLIIYFIEMLEEKSVRIRSFAYKKSEKLAGLVIILSIALHNLPEGMIIGASSTMSLPLDYIIIIALHNIPEGMAIAVPLLNSGIKPAKVLLICILTGLPTIIGGVLGFYTSAVSNIFTSLCLSLASGGMAYVVFNELFPISYNKKSAFSIISGVMLGLLLIFSL